MKTHVIIPIFIPHRGCPNDCIFCNQKKITARQPAVTEEAVRETVETWLSTIEANPNIKTVEIAFYGGSFTGLPLEEQNMYLAIAKDYKDRGRIHKIHMSTRPDYIDEEILDNLKKMSVDTIELGVQSFDDQVLKASNRGHDSAVVYRAAELIKSYGFELGIQLMVGLPGDSMEASVYSARETVKLKPSLARIYPTIVINDTGLYDDYKAGKYRPLTRDEAVERSKAVYEILFEGGITIMRVGLKSSDIISEGGEISGETFHPAFRQLVEGAIARERIGKDLEKIESLPGRKVDVYSNSAWFSNMIGNGRENKEYFQSKYPFLNIRYRVDNSLANGQFKTRIKEK